MPTNVSISDLKCDELDKNLIKDHYEVANKLRNTIGDVAKQEPILYAGTNIKFGCDDQHLLSQHLSHTIYQNMCKRST